MTGGPPPSQLISRRPTAKGPGALPLFGLPRAARKASTVSEIETRLAPESEKIVNALTVVGRNRERAKNAHPTLRIIEVIPYLSFGDWRSLFLPHSRRVESIVDRA